MVQKCEAETVAHQGSEAFRRTSKLTSEISTYCRRNALSLIDPSGVLHSVLYVITRKLRFREKFIYDREILILEDGGSVALDWRTGCDRDSSTSKVAIVQHGLCGHSQSSYVRSMVHELERQGFYVVVFIARGCGKLKLTTPETFTASRTADFKAVVQHVQRRCVGREIHSVGFSLGAGLLLKYLGENGDNSILKSAIAISPSFDFHKKTLLFDIFSLIAVRGLIKYVKENGEYLQSHPSSLLDWDSMIESKTIYEFDEAAIVGKHRKKHPDRYLHHPSVEEYYSKSSCIHVAQNITIPTLVLCAEDDPVCSIEGAPTSHSQTGKGLAVVKVKHGGHVGFGDSPFMLSPTFFCDRLAGLWFNSGETEKMLTSRYGGTIAPCDDPAPCEVSTRTGFHINTTIGPSGIQGAGLGRFVTEAVPAGDVIRTQIVGSSNLLIFQNKEELLTAFPLPQDLKMIADFALCPFDLPGVVLLDSPPTMVNHSPGSRGANTAFRFIDGKMKEVIATRDITPGEELLQDYRHMVHVSWLEELLSGSELQSAKQLGEKIGEK